MNQPSINVCRFAAVLFVMIYLVSIPTAYFSNSSSITLGILWVVALIYPIWLYAYFGKFLTKDIEMANDKSLFESYLAREPMRRISDGLNTLSLRPPMSNDDPLWANYFAVLLYKLKGELPVTITAEEVNQMSKIYHEGVPCISMQAKDGNMVAQIVREAEAERRAREAGGRIMFSRDNRHIDFDGEGHA